MSSPAVPYVVPFAVFVVLLLAAPYWPFDPVWEQYFRVVVLGVVLWVFSRRVIDPRCGRPGASVAVGIGVFVLWVLPDLAAPGWRSHWLFTNGVMGAPQSSIPPEALRSAGVLAVRTLRAAVLVPIIEELFWRAWLMRWLIDPDFEKVRLGAYSLAAVAITAVLFASEHGPYWEVGLAAGLVYNLWMVKTKRLGDVILAHGVTNLCLSLFTVATGRWEYWM